MHTGKLVSSQVMDYLPLHTFRRDVARYQGERYVKQFRRIDQYLVMAFAHLTYCKSLRDISVCLLAHQSGLHHMGIRSAAVARSALFKANEKRNWRICFNFTHALIHIARSLHADENLGLELENTIYALDISRINLYLPVFPQGLFRSTKPAVKLHTLLDLRGYTPTFIYISDGKLHDVNILDILLPQSGAFYIMDRRYSRPVNKSIGLRYDQNTLLTEVNAADDYPRQYSSIKYYDQQTEKIFNFLTNNFAIPTLTLADVYRYRWQVKLFFKWIK